MGHLVLLDLMGTSGDIMSVFCHGIEIKMNFVIMSFAVLLFVKQHYLIVIVCNSVNDLLRSRRF